MNIKKPIPKRNFANQIAPFGPAERLNFINALLTIISKSGKPNINALFEASGNDLNIIIGISAVMMISGTIIIIVKTIDAILIKHSFVLVLCMP